MTEIPLTFTSNGYNWYLLSVQWNISRFVSAEYENNYGHIKTFSAEELREAQ